MLKRYIYNGLEWQFEAGTQPKGAVEVAEPAKAEPEPAKKAVKPTANKARKETKTK